MINKNRLTKEALGSAALLLMSILAWPALAQVGISPAANTAGSFADDSIMRDSGIDQPLNLLNDFYPAIEVTIADHDNVRRRPELNEDDLKISVMPSLAYRTNFGRHQFYAAYSSVFTFHSDFEQEDAESNNLMAQLGLDLSQRWNLNLFAGIGTAYEERGISGTRPFDQLLVGPDRGPDTLKYQRYGADLIYGRNVSRLNAVLGFESETSKFNNNFQGRENFSGGRDRETDTLHFDLSYQLGSRTSVFGRLEVAQTDYQRELNSLDGELTNYLFGVRWKPSNALSGVIGVGGSERTFDDVTRSDFDGDMYYVNLNYMFNPFSNLGVTASRAVEEPGDQFSDYYESQLFGVSWNHSFTPSLLFNVHAKWIDDEYNTGRKDDFFDFGLGLDYVFRPWLTAGLYYGELERDSNINDGDYNDSYFGIRLRSDLRPLLKGRRSKVEPESFEYPEPSDI